MEIDDKEPNFEHYKHSFLFVVATTKKESESEELPLHKSFQRMAFPFDVFVDFKIFYENKKGLSEIYNSVIDEKGKEFDFIVFLHDDLWINDCFIFDKLIESAKNSDIIGICGGKSWEAYGDGNTQPIIWTHAARNKGMSGFMIHAADEKQDTVKHDMYYNGRSIFASNYGNSPSRVLTIDGCFMCLTKKAIEKGVRFDEKFKFHFYDMDMCFNAFVKNAKISTSPIAVTHESLGYSVRQKEFIESQKEFLKKWFN